ncbi:MULTISPECIES: hypothetical protein [Enterococcus]|uniref:hypothetical protein n=1 Tax=Enterococcus TaxID=1350 RepID=UPI000DE8C597|nr:MULTISPECIES: hypothetical protein [Enterococcus]EGP5171806.1 hypothetical protein [Enterococcus faecium]EGP5401508.1 hypothetical protein [Enterococcus faecium]MEB4597868.1 hypothetical protein [Enterococcus sp. E4-85]RBS57507.1 hypothetical protein EB35_00941 [Enterococcus faecium]
MDKRVAMKRIIELTHFESWQEDEEVIAEVQRLGKIANGRIRKKPDKRKQRKGKIIVVLHEGNILMQGTARELSAEIGYTRGTIRTYAWRNHVDKKGHEYKYLE